MSLWEDKYIKTTFNEQTLNGLIRYKKDKWGAVLYIENKLQSKEPQRIYKNERLFNIKESNMF